MPPDSAGYYAFLEELLRLFGIESSRHTPVDPRIAKLLLDLKSGTASNDTVAMLAKKQGYPQAGCPTCSKRKWECRSTAIW